MLAHHFVKWCETASTAERCAGVALLADAVTEQKFLPKETREAEAALLFALDDISPRVRRTMAVHVAASERVPRQLVLSLVKDVDDVATPVIAQSPLLTGADLASLARTGSRAARLALARRAGLPDEACRALAHGDDADAAREMVCNRQAAPSADTLRIAAQRFGGDGRIRELLLERGDLPADVRHGLLHYLSDSLTQSNLVTGLLGAERTERLRMEVQDRAISAVIEELAPEDVVEFSQHLRAQGALTVAVLLKAVCSGRIDLFAAALSLLTDHSERRVRAIIAEAREPAFAALVRSAGFPPAVVPLLLAAIRVWKDASGQDEIDAADVAASVIQRLVGRQRHEGTAAEAALLDLLEILSSETQRSAMRHRLERHLAA
ncbi:DUF2336 domain-containing protein [Aureimonas ureilytica]|uniref:DUF2336 domain-containing protein n=1 Tax=Aureimonas ureilytica TaxID=401562 RepID=UPI0009E68B4B|nr:DUF2336 domain-containing protein [Aureimonas ureilytica]